MRYGCRDNRYRYQTGGDNFVAWDSNGGNPIAFPLETSASGAQIMGGEIYLCSLYAPFFNQTESDMFAFIYDAGVNQQVQNLGVPVLAMRVPSGDTLVFEAARYDNKFFLRSKSESRIIEVETSLGMYFKKGIRMFASSTQDKLTVAQSAFYISSCDVIMVGDGCGPDVAGGV